MAEKNWYSAGDKDWDEADAWNTQADGLGTALTDPDTDAHVIIQGSDTITITAAIGNSIKSLTVDSATTLTGHASHPITISAEGTASFGTDGYAVRIHSGCNLGTNVKLIVETQADTWATLNAGGGTLDSLTINHASCKLILQYAATMGSLTITAGELDTHSNDYALTVTGSTNIDGQSAGTEASRLQLNGSTAILGSGITSAAGVYVANGAGFYADADSTVTMGSLDANYDGSNEVRLLGTNVIDSYSDINRILKITSGVIDTTGTNITITTATTGKTISCFDTDFGNLTLTPASSTTYNMVSSGIDIGGNLTISANATLDTTSSDYPLTVTGKTTIGGTLTCNASTCSFGAALTDDWGILMATGGDFDGGSAVITCGAIKCSVTATFDFSSVTTTIATGDGGDDRFFELDGGTVNHNSGEIIVTSPTSELAQWTTTTGDNGPWDLTINHASCTFKLRNALTVLNDLTITAGTFNTEYGGSGMGLTVAGTTSVAGTLICNDSDVSLGSTKINDWGLKVLTGGTFTGGSGTHTIGSIFGSTGGTPSITLSSGVTTINSKYEGNGYTLNIAANVTFAHGSGTVTMSTYAGNTLIAKDGSTLAFNNFILTNLTRTVELRGAMSCAGYCKILKGTLDTKSGSDYALTVEQYMQVSDSAAADTATLATNDSVCQFGATSYDGEYGLLVRQGGTVTCDTASAAWTASSIYVDGTYATLTFTRGVCTVTHHVASGLNTCLDLNGVIVHNSGTVMVTTAATTKMDITDKLYNLTIKAGSSTSQWVGNTTISGDLTISADSGISTYQPYSASYELTVTGDVIVSGTLNDNTGTAAYEFGSLTIADGGTYKATKGITSILSSASNYAIDNGGTFTHNEGTVTIGPDASNQWLKGSGTGAYYNLISDNSSSLGMGIGADLVVDNDLTINASKKLGFVGASYDITVTGTVLVSGNFTTSTTPTGDHTFGSLTIASGGEFIATSDTTTIAGDLQNNGTFTHNDGTFTNNTSGINIWGTSETVFYILNAANRTLISVDTTVAHSITGAGQIRTNGLTSAGGMTLTMGTSTVAGSITTGFFGCWSDNCTTKIYAANQLCPWTMTSGVNWQFGVANGELWHLKWGDVDPDIQTKDSYATYHKTITLDGDMEFDAVTVSSGDTLDLNGQRMECSGEYSNQGSFDNTGDGVAYIYAEGFNLDGAWSNDTNLKLILQPTGNISVDLNDDNMASTVQRMINAGTYTVTQDANFNYNSGDFILASGIYDTNDKTDLMVENLTIVADAELSGTSTPITVAGDFTTAGGLIGNSAYSSDGAAANYGTGAGVDLSSTSGPFTIEQWVKRADYSSGAERQISQMNLLQIYFAAGGTFHVKCGDTSNLQTPAGGNVNFSTTTGFGDGKWYHIAVVYDASASRKRKVFVDGKEYNLSNSDSTITLGNVDDYYIGKYYGNNDYNLDGQIGYLRIWDEARTVTEIRANMFKRAPTDASTKCKINLVFDEGTGVDVKNIGTELTAGDGTLNVGGTTLWAGAGTFTEGNGETGSTLVMSGTGSIITKNGDTFNKLTISGTTTLEEIVDGDAAYNIKDDLTIEGILASDATEYIYLDSNFGTNSGLLDFDDGAGDLTGLGQIINDAGVNVSIPEHTTKLWKTYDGATSTQTGDVTITTECEIASGGTWNANGNTITSKLVDANGTATLNLQSSSTLILSHTSGLTSESGVTLLAGGGGVTISGSSAATTFESQNDWKVVGKCENLNVTNEELNVTGQVINCTGDIIQQHQSVDAAQQLDYDSAEDRDIIMGRDLDKNTELVT